MRRIGLVFMLFSTLALADDRPPPAWLDWSAKLVTEPMKAFVAVGKSGENGPADFKSDEAEDDARQKMGQLVADWQEKTLACAKKASESTKSVKSKSGTGATLDWQITTETTVSFYRDRVVDRAYDGKKILVLLRHELAPMIAGIQADASRTQALRDAVKTCGERAFDDLVTGKP